MSKPFSLKISIGIILSIASGGEKGFIYFLSIRNRTTRVWTRLLDVAVQHVTFNTTGTSPKQYWKKNNSEKNQTTFYYCFKFLWNFNDLDIYRKWLFSLIFVVKILLSVTNYFLNRKFSEMKKELYFLFIIFYSYFFSLILYPNLGWVLCYWMLYQVVINCPWLMNDLPNIKWL